MEEREALEYEMTPPRPPGFYQLGSEGATIIVVTLRDPKLGCRGGWTETLYTRKGWNLQNKSHKMLLNI